MPYSPTWTNANTQGRVTPGHRIRLCDARELAAAINRRRRLAYLDEQDFSSHLHPLASVLSSTLARQAAPPFDSFRGSVVNLLFPAGGGIVWGEPPSPISMQWLWPAGGEDADKVIVSSLPDPTQAGLMEKLNGTGDWTDPILMGASSDVRTVHVNELRQALEWMQRGRWTLPVYAPAGIFSAMPDTPWTGSLVANNGTDELRSLGFAFLRVDGNTVRGLADVTVRDTSRLEITADADCTIQALRCTRELDFSGDLPSWNQSRPGLSEGWTSPGAATDAEVLGEIGLSAGQAGVLSGSTLAGELQAMIDGRPQNFLFRRTDAGEETIGIRVQAVVEFDLNSPPT